MKSVASDRRMASQQMKTSKCIIDDSFCSDNNIIDSNKSDKMQTVYQIVSSLGFSSPKSDDNKTHYGVFIPRDVRMEDALHVYTDKLEALKIMKQSKKARFKQFKNFKEAAEFAEHGAECVAPIQDPVTSGGEKQATFKGPKPQDLVLFRKAIEAGDLETVRTSINENPRYLVSSGDTPSILQEGCRYNALHVAAKSDQSLIAELILNSVESLALLSRLYDDYDEDNLKARSSVLLDLYLNTPDKSAHETPLHFAAKFGAATVVELLTSYRQCERHICNKFGATPKDVICSRASDEKKCNENAIRSMLEEQFYLPVLRYEDNSMPARLGEPFSPVKPLNIPNSPLSPRVEMPAYAGPMSKEQVSEFKKKWQTPPRTLRNSELRLTDPEKGHERFARTLAHEFQVPWREYWSFLDTYVDLSSKDGLDLLEKYLSRRFEETLNEVMTPVLEKKETSLITDDVDALSPISDLCKVFDACSLVDKPDVSWKTLKRLKHRKDQIQKLSVNDRISNEVAPIYHDSQFSSLLCVERSCQVFGKRICNVFLTACSAADSSSMSTENLRVSMEAEIKHLQTLVHGYQQDSRFQSVNLNQVHSRVAAIATAAALSVLTSAEKALLSSYLRTIALADGTVSDDEDILFSSRRDDLSSLSVVLKSHLLCLTERLLTEIKAFPSEGVELASVQNEAECQVLWAQSAPCMCDWEPYSHQARARAAWRRQQKMIPVILNFNHEEERGEDDAWRSCEGSLKEDPVEEFITPPSSPRSTRDDPLPMEDPGSMPDTFIYPGERPSKTDLAVLESIGECTITPQTYPWIYRWRHLVHLHQDNVVPCGQVAPSPGAWHRLRIPLPLTPLKTKQSPSQMTSPSREPWERVTGQYSPSPRRLRTTQLKL